MKMVLLVTACALLLSGCSKSVYRTNISSYTKVYDALPRTGFEMPNGLLSGATAITGIDKENDYSTDTYLYKNGTDTYILFNISSYVVAVSNQTTFGFDGKKSAEEKLTATDLNGIWFSPSERLSYVDDSRNNAYKSIMTVQAEVSITEDLFGTFWGKLATVRTEDGESSLFVGTKGDSYEKLSKTNRKTISYIAESLVSLPVEAVTTDESENAGTVSVSTESAVQEGAEQAEQKASEQTSSVTGTSGTDLERTKVEVPVATVESEDTEDKNNDSTNDGDLSHQEDATPSEKTSLSEVLSNSLVTASGEKSDLYHQLSVGDTGQLEGLGSKDTDDASGKITLTKIHTGSKAIQLAKMMSVADTKMTLTEPPIGCSIHVAEYTLSFDPEKIYVDIRLQGLGGANLVYRGVPYSQRTYDCYGFSKKTKEGYTTLYSVYAVPNGCTQYTLRFGNINGESKNSCAYFWWKEDAT